MPHRGYQIDQVSFFCVSMMDIWPKALTINQRVFRHILPEIGVHEMANIGLNSLFISLECLVSKETDPSSHKMPSKYYQVCFKRMAHLSSSDDWDRLDFIYQKYFLHWNFTLYLKKKISMAGIEQRVIRGSEGNKIPLLS